MSEQTTSSWRTGWSVVLATGVVAFVAWGIGFYQLGIFLNAFHVERGWNLTALSLSASIYFLIMGCATLVMGPVVDRHGPRAVLIFGVIVLSAGMAGLGQMRSLWHIYPAMAVLAIGFTCTSTLVIGAVISRWFVARRAFLMNLALIGAPLGALLMVPFSAWLLDQFGVAGASLILAAIPLLLLLPLALIVIRDHPVHTSDDGTTRPAASTMPGEIWTIREGLRSPVWWLLGCSLAAIMFGQVGFLVHQVNVFRPAVGLGTAALLVSVTGLFGIASRLLGWLGDRYPRHLLLAGYCGIQSIAFILTAFSDHLVALVTASAIVGLAMGSVVALQPLLLADRFGLRSYGTLFGSSTFLTHCGSASGIFLVGFLANLSGGYLISFTACAILALLAAVLATLSGRYPVVHPGVHRLPSTHSTQQPTA